MTLSEVSIYNLRFAIWSNQAIHEPHKRNSRTRRRVAGAHSFAVLRRGKKTPRDKDSTTGYTREHDHLRQVPNRIYLTQRCKAPKEDLMGQQQRILKVRLKISAFRPGSWANSAKTLAVAGKCWQNMVCLTAHVPCNHVDLALRMA